MALYIFIAEFYNLVLFYGDPSLLGGTEMWWFLRTMPGNRLRYLSIRVGNVLCSIVWRNRYPSTSPTISVLSFKAEKREPYLSHSVMKGKGNWLLRRTDRRLDLAWLPSPPHNFWGPNSSWHDWPSAAPWCPQVNTVQANSSHPLIGLQIWTPEHLKGPMVLSRYWRLLRNRFFCNL